MATHRLSRKDQLVATEATWKKYHEFQVLAVLLPKLCTTNKAVKIERGWDVKLRVFPWYQERKKKQIVEESRPASRPIFPPRE